METDKKFPHCNETEAVVLGTLIYHNNMIQGIHQVYDLLCEDHFYLPAHRDLYKVIKSLHEQKTSPELEIILHQMQKQNITPNLVLLSNLITKYTLQLHQYILVLQELHQRRQLATLALQLYKESTDETHDINHLIGQTKETLLQVSQGTNQEVATLNDAITLLRSQIEHNYNNPNSLTGTPTGFHEFDKKAGGLQGSDLIIIAGETSHGKTSLATHFALQATHTGAPVAFYSMEMKKEQLAARILAGTCGIPGSTLLYDKLDLIQIEQIEKGLAHLYNQPLYFDDRSTSSLDTLLASMRRLKHQHNIRGAIVDYLQILNVNIKAANRETHMAEAARRLKNIASELDIWVIALSQFNRDTNHAPLARLRDSGQIGDAADIVIYIERPQVHGKPYPAPFQGASTKGTALINIVKGRNIGLLQFLCGFTPATTTFYELDDIPYAVKDDDNPF